MYWLDGIQVLSPSLFPVDDDVDGVPLKEGGVINNGPAPGFVSSKWESVSPKRVQAQVSVK